jgi:hypothetical protein
MSSKDEESDYDIDHDEYNECDECLDFISIIMNSIYKELIPKLVKDYNLNETELIKIRKKWYNHTPVEQNNKLILMDDFKTFQRLFELD